MLIPRVDIHNTHGGIFLQMLHLGPFPGFSALFISVCFVPFQEYQ